MEHNARTSSFDALLKLLKRQAGKYETISGLEEGKREAILKRDGNALAQLSKEQEKIMQELENLEDQRISVLSGLAIQNGRTEPSKMSEVLGWGIANEEESAKLKEQTDSLRDILLHLETMSELNQSMLADNNALFHSIIEAFATDTEVGYGVEESKTTHTRPLFVDAQG